MRKIFFLVLLISSIARGQYIYSYTPLHGNMANVSTFGDVQALNGTHTMRRIYFSDFLQLSDSITYATRRYVDSMRLALAASMANYALATNVYSKSASDGRYLQSETDPKRIVSIVFSGTATKTATITLADATTVTGTFTDINGGGGSTYSNGYGLDLTGTVFSFSKTLRDSLIALIPTNNNQLSNGAGYALNSALSSYLTTSTAASTYAPINAPTFTGVVGFPSSVIHTLGGQYFFANSSNVHYLYTATAGLLFNSQSNTNLASLSNTGTFNVVGGITAGSVAAVSVNITGPTNPMLNFNNSAGITRTGAGIFAIGNGTAGNASGTINLATVNASALVTGSNVTSTNASDIAANAAAIAGKQDALPSQTGNSGKVLGTNGSALSWVTQTGGSGTSVYGLVDAYTRGMRTSNSATANATILQTVIDSLSAGSGGDIWLAQAFPCNPFTLKKGVHLKGNNTTAFKGSNPVNGATPTPGATPSGAAFLITNTSNPFLTYQSNTSVDGIMFYYPSQAYTATASASLINYPATIVKDTGIISSVSFTRLTFIGCTTGITGIGTNASTNYLFDMRIDAIYGYPLSGSMIDIRYCLDIPRITNCHVNPGAGVLTVGSRGGTTYQIAHNSQIIDYVVSNGLAAYRIDNTDEFMMDKCFAFGSDTAFAITNSYGQASNCNADMVQTGAYVAPNSTVKYVYLSGFSCIPSAGPSPSARNAIVFGGTGGELYIDALHSFIGSNGAVPSSSSPSANAILKVNGSGAQVARISKWGKAASAGSWAFANVEKTNTSATVEFALPSIDTTISGGIGGAYVDNFTGGAGYLESHVSDGGQTWTRLVPGGGPSTGIYLSGSGTAYSAAGSGAQTVYKSNYTPASADQQYSLTLDVKSNSGELGVCARFTGTDGSSMTFYGARYSSASGGLQLYKCINGAYTQLGSTYSYTPATGDVLTIVPTGSAIVVKINGTTAITATDSGITATGTVGLWGSNVSGTATTSVHATKLESN